MFPKGIKLNEEQKSILNMRGLILGRGWNKGKKQPEKVRIKISKSLIGKKHSEETKKKMSESHKGKKMSEYVRLKIKIANTGKISPFKGKTYKEIYGSEKFQEQIEKRRISHLKTWDKKGRKPKRFKHDGIEYVNWRMQVFQRDGWTCQTCGFRGYIEAHHIKSWINYPELRYISINGITLCKECHKIANKTQKKIELRKKVQIYNIGFLSGELFQ